MCFSLVLFSQQSLHFAEYGTLGLSLPILRQIRRDFEYHMIKKVYTSSSISRSLQIRSESYCVAGLVRAQRKAHDWACPGCRDVAQLLSTPVRSFCRYLSTNHDVASLRSLAFKVAPIARMSAKSSRREIVVVGQSSSHLRLWCPAHLSSLWLDTADGVCQLQAAASSAAAQLISSPDTLPMTQPTTK